MIFGFPGYEEEIVIVNVYEVVLYTTGLVLTVILIFSGVKAVVLIVAGGIKAFKIYKNPEHPLLG